MADNILVIKLSALGDFVQATGPFKSIREHHKEDNITLLTTKLYAPIAQKSGFFDEVIIDERPKSYQFLKWLKLRKLLSSKKYKTVYDLQTSGRSCRYYYLMRSAGFNGDWSGIVKGCSLPHANSERNNMHTIDRQAEQLKMAGIDTIFPPDISWLKGDVSKFGLENKTYALLVAGGAPHRPAKRWNAELYAELANRLYEKRIIPVVIGTKAEKKQVEAILDKCKNAISLLGKTSFEDIASLAMEAKFAVGNDTGPMHMIAIANCPSVVLYSNESNPQLCGQRGEKVKILRKPSLDDLTVDEVFDALFDL